MADIIIDTYTKATLPAAGLATRGRLAYVTDNVKNVWCDNGTQWFQISGGFCNVVDFGAKMNDSTARSANRTALQTAIRAAYDIRQSGLGAGVVQIPPGVLNVTSTTIATEITGVAWIYPEVSLIGSGWGSIIDATDSATTSYGLLGTNNFHAPNAAGGGNAVDVIPSATDVQLRDFWIKGSSSQSGYSGLISLTNNSRWILDSLRVSGSHGFNVLLNAGLTGFVTDIRISNCYVHDSIVQSGIVITDAARRISVVGNICRGNGLYGIQIEDRRTSTDVTITGNVCDSNGHSGILVWGPAFTPVRLTSITRVGTLATATSSSNHGLVTGDVVLIRAATPQQYNGTFQVPVTGNTTFTYQMVSDPGSSASGASIDLTNAYNQNIAVSANVCVGNVENGIMVGGGVEAVSVVGNVCRGNQQGVKLSTGGTGASYVGVRHVTVSGNTLTRNSKNGLLVSAGTGETASFLNISGNTISNNCQQAIGTGAGISLSGTGTIQDVDLVGNVCADDQPTPTQGYGISLANTGTIARVAIVGNSLRGNVTQQLLVNGTDTLVRDNHGALSAWVSPAFNAADFTATESMTWTVDSADVTAYHYIEGPEKTMTVNFSIDNTNVGGTPMSYGLRVKIPNGRVSTKLVAGATAFNNAGLGWDTGFCQVLAGGTHVICYRNTAGPWTATSANNTTVRGSITFEFQ